jgi:hypothetical protein
MDTSAASGVDPTDWTALIEQAFFARLREVRAPDDVEQQVRSRLAELDEQLLRLVHNAMDAANVRFTSLAVAAYDVLEPAHGPAGATAVVEDCRTHAAAGRDVPFRPELGRRDRPRPASRQVRATGHVRHRGHLPHVLPAAGERRVGTVSPARPGAGRCCSRRRRRGRGSRDR